MFKILSFLGCITFCVGCSAKHKTPKEIYQSGKVDNFNDFVRVDTNKIDDDDMVDEYVYKYDTLFRVQKMYTYTYSTQKRTFRNFGFYYKGKKEGKVVFYNPNGTIMGTVYFKDDIKQPYLVRTNCHKYVTIKK